MPSPMIENAPHYRYMMFKKLFQSNLWDSQKMFFYARVLSDRGDSYSAELRIGTNIFEVAEPGLHSTYAHTTQGVADFFAKCDALPDLYRKLQNVSLVIHGFDMQLSSNGIRGRAPNNLINANTAGETPSLRTVYARPPSGANIMRTAAALYRIYSGAVADRTMDPYMSSHPLPATLNREVVDRAMANPIQPDSQYFWTDRDSLTHRPITEVLTTLERAYQEAFKTFFAVCSERAYFNTLQIAINETQAARMTAQRAALEAERLARRQAELVRIENMEAERRLHAVRVLENISKYADLFESTIPNRRKKGEKSIENMGNFLTSMEDLGIAADTDDENPLTPAVSFDYPNGALLSLVSNENGVFVENINIPQEKLQKFVKMLKEL